VAPAVGAGGSGIDGGLARPFAARLFGKRAAGMVVPRQGTVRQSGPTMAFQAEQQVWQLRQVERDPSRLVAPS
jgi:hypothetical protein